MTDVKSRREHIRKRAQFPLRVRTVTDAQGGNRPVGEARFVGLNVSSRGIGLETLFELKGGETLDFELTLPGSTPISACAIIRSITTEKRGQHLVYRAGLEFTKISEGDQKTISSYAANMGVIV